MNTYSSPPPALPAPRPQQLPSSVPTDKLASQADTWYPHSQPQQAPYPPQMMMPPQVQPQQGWQPQRVPSMAYPAPPPGMNGYGPPPPGMPPYGAYRPPQGGYAMPPTGPPQLGQHPAPGLSASMSYPNFPTMPPAAPPATQQQMLYAPPQQQAPTGHLPRGSSMVEFPTQAMENLSMQSSPASQAPVHPGSVQSARSAASDSSVVPQQANERWRPSYYGTPKEGPPHKLCATHPDLQTLREIRESLGNNPAKKVAWAKQVLRFIERAQATASDSTRISDPTLVRWTGEALGHIMNSAASPNPVPLALFLRGDLSSSGSFPSFRAKDPKSAFRDFEAAANAGYHKSWFRIARAYEDFGDLKRAVAAYEKGAERGDCASMFRLAIANLSGQIGVPKNEKRAVSLLARAADCADLDTPQPPYMMGMLLAGEFENTQMQVSKDIVEVDLDEARKRIEWAAYLSFGPAQYKMGFSYESATLGCLYDPFLSVQYYVLASKNGEVEADMALSRWYLSGADGHFDKNENLAVSFAEKAAARGLPGAEFALGYYREVGVGGPTSLDQAKSWYVRAASHGNTDAQDRLDALGKSAANTISRTDHEQHVDTKLVRKRTQAKSRSDQQKEAMAADELARTLGGGPVRPMANGSLGPANGAPAPQQQRPLPQPTGQAQRLDPQQRDNLSAQVHGHQRPGSYDHGHMQQSTMHASEQAARLRVSQTAINSRPNTAPQHPGQYAQQAAQHGQRQEQSAFRQSHGQGYQLSDRPMPVGRDQSASPTRPITMAPPPTKPHQTFAEMGIPTAKAKADDCIIQ